MADEPRFEVGRLCWECRDCGLPMTRYEPVIDAQGHRRCPNCNGDRIGSTRQSTAPLRRFLRALGRL